MVTVVFPVEPAAAFPPSATPKPPPAAVEVVLSSRSVKLERFAFVQEENVAVLFPSRVVPTMAITRQSASGVVKPRTVPDPLGPVWVLPTNHAVPVVTASL